VLSRDWSDADVGERQAFQTWLLAAIGVLTSGRPMTIDEVKGAFAGARHELVQRHLERLALMREVNVDADGRYGGARKAA
jgi:hypothetical protein